MAHPALHACPRRVAFGRLACHVRVEVAEILRYEPGIQLGSLRWS